MSTALRSEARAHSLHDSYFYDGSNGNDTPMFCTIIYGINHSGYNFSFASRPR